jgi:hypothetical protein
MKKYVIVITSTGITAPSGVTALKRNTNVTKGVLLNSTHIEISDWSGRTLPADHSDPALFITGRQVSLMPESTSSNTLITNDGLVAVFYQISSVLYMSLLDIFDVGQVDFDDDIEPADYSALLSYTLSTNPEHERIFVAYKAGSGDNFETGNLLVYKDATHSYFASDMDTGLPTDDYGYHKIATASFQAETDDFTFLKKQFFVIEGPSDMVASADVTLEEVYADGGTKVYWLKDTDISGENDLVTFNFTSSAVNYTTIKVY